MPKPVRYQTGGALLPGDRLYIHRGADDALLEALADDEFCYVLAPRQIGKSSLLARTVNILRGPDKAVRVATANLGAGANIRSEKEWYEGVIRQLADTAAHNPDFVLPFAWEEWWERQTGPHPQLFIAFLREAFLDASPDRWVVAIDEIDATLNLRFRASFFAAIRLCHDFRPGQPVFRRLSVVLLGVRTPDELIADCAQTTFNIGRRIEMTDFSLAEAAPLAGGLPGPESEKERVLQRIYYWTDGHPYLTLAICDELARSAWSNPDPVDEAAIGEAVDRVVGDLFFFTGSRGQNSHLGYIEHQQVRRFPDVENLLRTYASALREDGLQDLARSNAIAELKISGLLKQVANLRLRVRNRIYEKAFDEKWANATISELRSSTGPILAGRSREAHPRGTSTKRFDVALTFAGEQRDYVRVVANCIALEFGKKRVFFDEWHKAAIAGRDASDFLQSIYAKDSSLIVVFLSKDYERKTWPGGIEWRAVKAMLNERAGRSRHAILPCRFAPIEMSGLFANTDVFIDCQSNDFPNGESEQQLATLICDKLALLLSDEKESQDQ